MSSVSRWIFLSITLIMLICASQVWSSIPIDTCLCKSYTRVTEKMIQKCHFQQCFDQTSSDCIPAYLLITKNNRKICINPEAPWISGCLQKEKLTCGPMWK